MTMRSLPLVCALSLALGSPAIAAEEPGANFVAKVLPEMPLAVSPQAASWKPALIKSVDAYLPGPPPAFKSPEYKKEMAELLDWQKHRGSDDLKAIAYWNDTPVPMRWSEEVRAEIITASMVPPRAARALALVHAAMYDAMVVSWKAKAKYRRALPNQENPYLKPVNGGEPGVPSYPSEHAAISMAAATVMASIFPDHGEELIKKARLVGETRIAAGANHRTDVDAGLKIGEQVAKEILAQRAHDGADLPTPKLAKQPGKWWVPEPMEPGAGSWGTFLMKNGHQFRIYNDMPDDPKNPRFKKAYDEVVEVHKHLTPHQIERAIFWNFDVPALLWNDIARRAVTVGRPARKPDAMGIIWSDIARKTIQDARYDIPHTTRMLNVLHLALADSFIACWDSKYTNLYRRPFMAAPSNEPLQTVVPTPPHASWPSGHATASATAAVVLGAYFPSKAKQFDAQAKEAAMSRLWGGIHYRKDNNDGLALGAKIGKYDLEQAKAKGWLTP